ncbi:MAG: single-stranded DNA-binding protein, partial [Alistipes sp.]|nr:single-stranded DNA-binding protein [Alistipes sp.]
KLLGRRSDNQQAGAPMGGQQGYSQPQGGYSQPSGASYAQPAAQPAQPSSIPAPQDDPDDLPF